MCPTEEKALFGGKAVDFFRAITGDGFFVSGVSDGKTTKVADALPEHELSVQVEALLDVVAIELIDDAIAPLGEILAVFRRPPFVQISFSIKLGTLIVKSVADLVPNDRPDTTVIYGVVRVGIVERRLEEMDF